MLRLSSSPRRHGFLLLYAVSALVVSTSRPAGAQQGKPSTTRAVLEAYYKAYEALDVEGALRWFADDALFEDPGLRLAWKGKAAIRAGLTAAQSADPTSRIRFDVRHRVLEGDRAFVEGTFHFVDRRGPDSMPFAQFFRFRRGQIAHQVDHFGYADLRARRAARLVAQAAAHLKALTSIAAYDSASVDAFMDFYADSVRYDDPTLGMVGADRARVWAGYRSAFSSGGWGPVTFTPVTRFVSADATAVVVEGRLAGSVHGRPFETSMMVLRRFDAGGLIARQIDYVDYRPIRAASRSVTSRPRTFVARDGAKLAYHVVGDTGPFVVVPLGFMLSKPLATLSRGRRMVFYDMRGRGASAPATGSTQLGLERDIDDLEDLRLHLGADRISVIGFSYLGAMAAAYAARWPDRVDRLVLLSAVGPRSLPIGSQAAAKVDAGRVSRLQAALGAPAASTNRALCTEFWGAYLPMYASEPATVSVAEALTATCDYPNEHPTAFLRVLGVIGADLAKMDLRSAAAKISAAALVIHGADDLVAVPQSARDWLAALPAAALRLVTGAGHLALLERPAEVLPLIDDFLPRS